MKKRIVLISALILLGLLTVLAFFFQQSQPKLEEEPNEVPTKETQNPIEDEIPDVNPTANTNPFSDTYKNPFE